MNCLCYLVSYVLYLYLVRYIILVSLYYLVSYVLYLYLVSYIILLVSLYSLVTYVQ